MSAGSKKDYLKYLQEVKKKQLGQGFYQLIHCDLAYMILV